MHPIFTITSGVFIKGLRVTSQEQTFLIWQSASVNIIFFVSYSTPIPVYIMYFVVQEQLYLVVT